jgi:uncharacterized Zn finger protein (UPF0148 family)
MSDMVGLRLRVAGIAARAVARYMTATMFCPKCAAELIRHDGELTCVAGEMGLSRSVEQRLIDRYGQHVPSTDRTPRSTNPRPWFCPGCGVMLDADMVCPHCQMSLKDLEFQLVELHPHKGPDGTWR